ncbi:zinc ribbon domain-containing protein [Acetobacterium wieringae]|uniref:Zinc ribbon domain-containing protein n=1 Tax=Acetobacterium wieringae TaxID=52694 RepID=A0ABY6HAN0_9FIRM|nr:zinc ribbon domain-containing protein [Acetobacterium wieringae]UYO61565.1 zinc ribbon domain-containing protein [Acetobacterium wieringae]
MFCENCGKQIPDDAAFCTHCGAKQLGKSASSQSVSSTQSPQPTRASAPTPSVQKNEATDLITMGQYLIMFLITAIPIAGIVMLFIWGFGSETGPNKKNFARAYLVMMAITVGAAILISIVMGAIMAFVVSTMYYY